MFKTIHTPTTPICGILSPRRGPSANGSDAWRFGSCGPARVLDFSLMANVISLSVSHTGHKLLVMRRTSLLTKGHILSRQNAPKRAKKQIWHGDFLIFSVVVMATGGVRRMPSRVAEVMQFHGQNPPYISMYFRSLLLLQSRTKLALFLALSFTSHKRNIFSSFYVFPISATPPTNSSKKKKLPCAKEHYLGCPGGPSSTARSLEALDLD